MTETERVTREDCSIQVDSTEGYNESLLIEDIGGVMLLSLSGHQAPRGLENAPEVATTAFDRDTIKYDIAEWIRKRAQPELALDGQALSDETFRVIDLLDTYRSGARDVAALQSEIDKLSTKNGQLAAKKAAVEAFMQQAINEYCEDAISSNETLRRRILKESEELQGATGAEIEARIAVIRSELNNNADALEATTGQEIIDFKESGTEAVKKLIAPIRELVRLELIVPGASFEGMVNTAVTYGKYGPNSKKMAMYVPNILNGTQIPMTYGDALAFADATSTEARKSTSIFG